MSDENSNYTNVGLDNPEDVFKVSAKISTFGGPEDVASGQDNGQFAFGGSSVGPSGSESDENYAAIDPAWYKNGIQPGSTVYVQNPKTGVQMPVVLRDKGPARWTGRGIDVAPHVLDQLGMATDDHAIIDFKPAFGQSDQQDQPKEDLTTSEGAKSYLDRAAQDPSSMLASVDAPSSGAQKDVTGSSEQLGVTKLPDGGYDLGGGVVGYPNGIFQARTGNSTTEYIPDESQPGGYKTHTFQTKASDTSPKAVAIKKAAEKGILREDYPEGPDGEKQFNDEVKLSLGAGVADDIAEAIMSGSQPPDTKGLYRTGPQVRAKLAQKGYNLKDANLDWQASQRFILSQNSPPLVRLRQSAMTADHSLDVIDELAKKWKAGNFPALNKARLVAAQQGVLGPEAASIARQLDGQITDLTFELGNVYMGGGTPTDKSLQLAQKNLSADWDEKVLLDMTNLARRNLGIRLNSFKQVTPAGLTDDAEKEARWSKAHPESSSPTASPAATPQQYKVSQSVKLRNGQVVTIKKINPDGTFEY